MTTPAGRELAFTVDEAAAGQRLDRWLAHCLPERSRSYLSGLVRRGRVRVDAQPAKPGQLLKAGQRVAVALPAPTPLDLRPEALPLEILFEDDDLAVVNKPAGMVVHPAVGNREGTLVHALLHHLEQLSGIGDRLRPGIVHRLDKDTSGLLIAAKSDRAHRRLVEMLAGREIRRRYLAIVWGHLAEAAGTVDAPLGRDPRQRKRMAVVQTGGKQAQTRYSRIDTYLGFDYIRLELGTGRTHQIRVHMAHLGHPLLGDQLYGGRRNRLRVGKREDAEQARQALALMPRQALHAESIRFAHPVTGEEMEFKAPLPPDMAGVLEWMRKAHSTEES